MSQSFANHLLPASYCSAHLLQRGSDIRTIQAQLGRSDIRTTQIYTHLLNTGSMTSPAPETRFKSALAQMKTSAVPYDCADALPTN
ncbi:tyrosine-type recombinase/integrase [Agarivorans sp. QJM3NY_25]|uniref:tyrosine-type recombinase/integrase n=1 Tax=Agarivorans sp. QJM3NY_25 TaxID=3421430 RepID=UPI003D7F04B4